MSLEGSRAEARGEICVDGGDCARRRRACAADASGGAGHVGGLNEADEGFSVNNVAVTNGQGAESVRAVELRRRIRGVARPAAERGGNDGAGCGVNGHHLRAENSGDVFAGRSGGKIGEREGICRKDASGDEANVGGVRRIGIERAQAGAVIVGERRIGRGDGGAAAKKSAR